MPLFKQCCRCPQCGGPIAVGDLPDITIPDYTGGLWKANAACCWTKEFTPNEYPIPWEFIDGGPLQVDGWTVISDYDYTWLMMSRGNLIVPGKIQQVDSGGPYTPVDVGDIDWWPGNFAYVVDPYPDCPTCETEACLSVSESDNNEIMQRWGVYRQLQGITVSLQKILVTCGDETEPTCQYIMSSRKRFKYKTYFKEFYKRHQTATWSRPLYSCCELPSDTDELDDYPDFNSITSYDSAVPPNTDDAVIKDIVSVRLLADLDEQDVSFGWDICDDCIPSGVAFCLGNCSDNCLTTEGTGIVSSGPFGHTALCDYMEPTACTYTQQWNLPDCAWSGQFTWSNGRIDCVKADCFDEFEPHYLPDCRTLEQCETTWTLYSFAEGFSCGPLTLSPSQHIGFSFGGLGTGCPSPTYYIPVTMIGTACVVGDPNPQRIGTKGSMTGLSYTPYCSGPIEQNYCFEENWTVTILPAP